MSPIKIGRKTISVTTRLKTFDKFNVGMRIIRNNKMSKDEADVLRKLPQRRRQQFNELARIQQSLRRSNQKTTVATGDDVGNLSRQMVNNEN